MTEPNHTIPSNLPVLMDAPPLTVAPSESSTDFGQALDSLFNEGEGSDLVVRNTVNRRDPESDDVAATEARESAARGAGRRWAQVASLEEEQSTTPGQRAQNRNSDHEDRPVQQTRSGEDAQPPLRYTDPSMLAQAIEAHPAWSQMVGARTPISSDANDHIGAATAGDTSAGAGAGAATASDTTAGAATTGDTMTGDALASEATAGDTMAGDAIADVAMAGDALASEATAGDTMIGDALASEATAGDTMTGDAIADVAMAGDALAGDATAGNTMAGDTMTDDTMAGDAIAGDATAGDAMAGDAIAGDATAGNAMAGDAIAGDAMAGDTTAGDIRSPQRGRPTRHHRSLQSAFSHHRPRPRSAVSSTVTALAPNASSLPDDQAVTKAARAEPPTQPHDDVRSDSESASALVSPRSTPGKPSLVVTEKLRPGSLPPVNLANDFEGFIEPEPATGKVEMSQRAVHPPVLTGTARPEPEAPVLAITRTGPSDPTVTPEPQLVIARPTSMQSVVVSGTPTLENATHGAIETEHGAKRGQLGPSHARFTFVEDDDRISVTVSAVRDHVRVQVRVAASDLATAIRNGSEELDNAFAKHGLVLGDFSAETHDSPARRESSDSGDNDQKTAAQLAANGEVNSPLSPLATTTGIRIVA